MDKSEVILASLLDQDPSEVSKIPEDLRLVLIGNYVLFNVKLLSHHFMTLAEKFQSLRNELHIKKNVEQTVVTRQIEDSTKSSGSSTLQQPCTILDHQSTEDILNAADLSFGFSTAADALASEAAFMENFGLYLNPRQSLAKIHGNKTPNTNSKVDHVQSGDHIETETDFLFLVGDGHQNSQETEASSKSRQSLLSFLNKGKSSEDLDAKEQVDEGSTSLRLWHPETESNENIWDDLFPSTAEMYNIDTPNQESTTDVHERLMDDAVDLVTEISSETLDEQSTQKYHCAPCNRSLSGKDAYYRHTLSELHFKRSSSSIDESFIQPRNDTKQSPRKEPKLLSVPKEPQDKNIFDLDLGQCPSCGASIPAGCLGKHLVSHWHYHRSVGKPNHRALILSNITEIVKQAPFQCAICRFYCNFSSQFIQHWKSQHENHNLNPQQRLWCSTCRVMCRTGREMCDHLKGSNHQEQEAMLNRSIPIIIKQIELRYCALCGQNFRLNFSLSRHMEVHHPGTSFKLADHPIFDCHLCSFRSSTKSRLNDHHFFAHANNSKTGKVLVLKPKFSCRLCCQFFKSKHSYFQHKLSQMHLTKMKEATMSCHICGVENLKNLEEHLVVKHFEESSQCVHCGMLFSIPQKLSSHIRQYKYKPHQPDPKFVIQSGSGGVNCQQCWFVGKSPETLELHLSVVHNESLSCTQCQATFLTKSKLSHHLLVHRSTNHELRCQHCSALFPSKSVFDNHQCRGRASAKQHRNIPCQVDGCQYVTNKMSAMKSHLLSHVEAKTIKRLTCSQPSCKFSCTRSSELKRHQQRVHCNETPKLRCTECAYATFSRQHLARHQKTMHGHGVEENLGIVVEPSSFHCRFCSYSCHSLDNMRKHILKTKKHRNLQVYNCQKCSYSHNSALDFRGHIERYHAEEYENAENFVRYYFAKS